MEQFSYIFTIFFITIGPLKIIPLFYGMTIELDEKSLKKLALKGTWFSLIIILLLALVVTHMLKAWRISIPSVTVAGSILLFISSLKMILAFKPPGAGAKHAAESEITPQSLSPKETSLLGSLEPLSAVLTTVFWLHEPFGFLQWVGTACIVGMILLLAINSKPSKKSA